MELGTEVASDPRGRFLYSMISILLISIVLQLSIFLLFQKLSRSMKKPRLWTGVTLILMVVPLSSALYQLAATHSGHPPLSYLLPLIGSCLATIASLCLVPTAYLVMGWHERQSRRVREMYASLQAEIVQRKKAEEELRALSLTDELTGLLNRRGLMTMGEQQLKLSRRTRRRLLLIYADLDNMKRINDKFGHMEGDAALIEVADVLREVFRESDILARIGGDEFVILAVDSNGVSPEALMNRIHQRCILANLKRSRPYVLAISAGSAEFNPDQPDTLEGLVAQADRSMYAVKQARHKRPRKGTPKEQEQLDIFYGSGKAAS